MDAVSEVEDAADLCRLDTKPLSREDAIRVAALAGMRDRSLAEKALSEEFSLQKLISVGTSGEQHQLAPGIVMEGEEISEYALDTAFSNLTVMKMKKAGKYSVWHMVGFF